MAADPFNHQVFDPDAKHHAEELWKDRDDRILSALWVSKINTKQGLDHRLLIFSESVVTLYKKPILAKTLKMSRIYNWFELKIVKTPQPIIIELHFNSANQMSILSFTHELAPSVLEIIVKHLTSIFLHFELPTFEIKGFDPLKIRATSSVPLNRLRVLLLTENTRLIDNLLDSFQAAIAPYPSEIDVSTIPEASKHLSAVFEALSVCTFLKRIIIPSIDGHARFSDIAVFIRVNRVIPEIVFDQKINEVFPGFIRAFEGLSSTNNAFSSLVFKQYVPCQYAEQVASLLSYYPLKSLTFYELKSRFVSIFAKAVCLQTYFKSLQSISFIGLISKDIMSVIELWQDVPEIRLIGCEIEVASFFGVIRKNRSKTLNLSRNRCHRGQYNYIIPIALETLIVDDVDFQLQHFETLFTACAQKGNMRLSLCRAHGDSSIFRHFFANLLSISGDFKELHWDDTPLRYELFAFLEKCPSLEVLSISGCLNTDEMVINAAEFISCTQKIEVLEVCGTKHCQLKGANLSKIIKALQTNRSLKKVDLSGNCFETDEWDDLTGALLSNRVIEEVKIDHVGLQDLAILIALAKMLKPRGKPIRIPYPAHDIYDLIVSGAATAEDAEELKELLRMLEIGDGSIEISPECIEMGTPRTPRYIKPKTGLPELRVVKLPPQSISHRARRLSGIEQKISSLPKSDPDAKQSKKIPSQDGKLLIFPPVALPENWKMSYPPLKEFENDEIMTKLMATYTLANLLDRVRHT